MNVPLFNELDIGKALAKGCRVEIVEFLRNGIQ
jgi:hypothetical protein